MPQLSLPIIILYGITFSGMIAWGYLHLDRRREAARRIERIQQLVVVTHFMVVAGWFIRYRIGLGVPESAPTTLGIIFEVVGAISAVAIGAVSILLNPGVRWNRFFVVFGLVAALHAAIFGGVALRYGESLGLVPDLEEIIRDRSDFGKPDTNGP